MNLRIVFLRTRSRMRVHSTKLILLILLLIFLILLGLYRHNLNQPQTVGAGLVVDIPNYWIKQAFNHGLPLLMEGEQDVALQNTSGINELFSRYLQARKDPKAVVVLELGWLSALERTGWELLLPVNAGLSAAPPDGEVQPVNSNDELEESDGFFESTDGAEPVELEGTAGQDWINKGSGTPLIAIYNTHNAETYIPTAGKARVDGENGGVALVAQTLTNKLEEKYGITTVYADTIHDYPDYIKSYTNSSRTVKTLLEKYPDLKILIDVHRDALPSKDSLTMNINGQSTARIMFVVGSDERSPHPNWKQNQALAQKINDVLESKQPGICRGVRVKPGTYNQQLHPGAILVEVGNDNNSLKEAERAVIILAEALSEVLKQ